MKLNVGPPSRPRFVSDFILCTHMRRAALHVGAGKEVPNGAGWISHSVGAGKDVGGSRIVWVLERCRGISHSVGAGKGVGGSRIVWVRVCLT